MLDGGFPAQTNEKHVDEVNLCLVGEGDRV